MFKKTSSRALAASLACALAIGAPALLAASPRSRKGARPPLTDRRSTDQDLKIATDDLGEPACQPSFRAKRARPICSIS